MCIDFDNKVHCCFSAAKAKVKNSSEATRKRSCIPIKKRVSINTIEHCFRHKDMNNSQANKTSSKMLC